MTKTTTTGTNISNADMIGGLLKSVNEIRMAKAHPALAINKNLCRAAQYRVNRWASGELDRSIALDRRTPLELAAAAWYTGDRVEQLTGYGQSDLLSYVPGFESQAVIWDAELNEVGGAFAGGPYGLYLVVLLGHRASFPDAEETGADLPCPVAEGLSYFDQAQWIDSKFQW